MKDNDGTAMPGSRIGGQGEMGAPLEGGPPFEPTDSEGNVTGAGTNEMLDSGDVDSGGGSGGYGAGYGGGGQREGGAAESYGTDAEDGA
jgi:hypothetical protein